MAALRSRALLRDNKVQKGLTKWELEVNEAGRRWQVLEPSSLRSAAGTTLTALPDGSILATGPRPDKDVYTVVAHLGPGPGTAIRLELLTDGSLTNRGPCRQDNGNQHFELSFPSSLPHPALGGKQNLAWRKVQADFNQDGWTIAQAVDGNPKTAWGIYPQVGKNHQGVFTLAEPISDGLGVTLLIELRQTHGTGHLIGRFRLATADTAEAGEVTPLPEEIAADLALAPDRRTEHQRLAIGSHYSAPAQLRRRLVFLASAKPGLLRHEHVFGRWFLPASRHAPTGLPLGSWRSARSRRNG